MKDLEIEEVCKIFGVPVHILNSLDHFDISKTATEEGLEFIRSNMSKIYTNILIEISDKSAGNEIIAAILNTTLPITEAEWETGEDVSAKVWHPGRVTVEDVIKELKKIPGVLGVKIVSIEKETHFSK